MWLSTTTISHLGILGIEVHTSQAFEVGNIALENLRQVVTNLIQGYHELYLNLHII